MKLHEQIKLESRIQLGDYTIHGRTRRRHIVESQRGQGSKSHKMQTASKWIDNGHAIISHAAKLWAANERGEAIKAQQLERSEAIKANRKAKRQSKRAK